MLSNLQTQVGTVFGFIIVLPSTIVEEGYGYDTEETNGTSAATFQALEKGDVSVYMEVWTDNLKEIYEKALEKGTIRKLIN